MRNRVLVTVVGPDRALDLELPADCAIGELLPFLCELCASSASALAAGPGERPRADAGEEWLLFLAGSHDPLAPEQTLSEAGIFDGVRLLLRSLPPHSERVAAIDTQELFLPSSIAPSERTGGIGVSWEQLPLT
ncbi:EsaB/YukD family protein [Thermogemmatispora sp.]|uniref:EsaB/YukD family protein n=1 Tax=Thermogemmatispora sp. TaxID=1968838 RepID=UPI0035E419E9